MRSLRLGAALAFIFSCGVASAQNPAPAHVRGTIADLDGTTLSIKAPDGTPITVHLAPGAKIIAATKASLVDVTPGSFVGIANVGPNGLQDALEVHIFPKAMRGTGEGQKPWDLAGHSRMTNGTAGTKVESYDGQDLTVTYKGGESTIQVRPNTPVIRLEPGVAADLKTGATVFVRDGIPQSDGSFLAESIVVGKGGAKPSM